MSPPARAGRSGRRASAAPPPQSATAPAGSAGALRPTRLGRRLSADDVIYRHDPRGREYLWIGGSEVEHDLTEGTDTHAWEQGKASVTPLTLALDDEAGADLCRTIAG